ncbi:MAG: peptide/nickel transport system permease protein [Thermomicrobiales bacterium]|nr:peptide/nickel transport system permease protein [Thermomicrobiales bacterium]MEA2593882.1 peptide/nickel transport system permease protein [Thermomicrobiales bacterium]
MTAFLLRRLLQMVPVLVLVMALVFVIFRMIPGDPAILILGANPNPEALVALRHKFGLDQPIPVQFVKWLGEAARGDLGVSRINDQPVVSLVLEKFPATLELALVAMLIGCAIGIPAGIVSALRRDSWLDLGARVIGLFGFSLPNYWLAILLVILFSLKLGWLPPAGYIAPSEDLGKHLRYLILPAVTLGLPVAAEQMRFLRASMLDVIQQDYVRTARSKGLHPATVVLRHAMKNALIPFLTITGLQVGFLLGGSVVIEQIFTWPGIGWLTFQSIEARDYAVVQGTVLLSAIGFLLMNLLVDVGYMALDPRIRDEQ